MILDVMVMIGHTVAIYGGLHLRPPNRDTGFSDKKSYDPICSEYRRAEGRSATIRFYS
jgi:hypothetical protein